MCFESYLECKFFCKGSYFINEIYRKLSYYEYDYSVYYLEKEFFINIFYYVNWKLNIILLYIL